MTESLDVFTKLNELSQLINTYLRAAFPQNSYEVTRLQGKVLAALSANKSMTMSDLANRLSISKPNVTPIIEDLTKNGLVERSLSIEDHRVIYVRNTEKGEQLNSEIQTKIKAFTEAYFQKLSQEQFNSFIESLDKCVLSFIKATESF